LIKSLNALNRSLRGERSTIWTKKSRRFPKSQSILPIARNMIRTYQRFIELRNAIEDFPPAGRIYTKPKVDRKSILEAEYVVVPSREVDGYADEKGGRIPFQLAGKNYTEWLEAPTLREIILDRLDRDAKAPLQDIIDAVFYYEEYDTFKDAD